jgi:pimeloyl-ACP methyl ester carboxylesterase
MAEQRDGFIDFRGMRVWYHVAGPLPTADGRPPLLALHGGPGGTSDGFEPLDALADRGRTVVRYDEFGSGRSDRPSDPSLWQPATFVDLLGCLRAELRLDPVHLLGWSWGGMVILDYLRTRPAGVASIVLLSALTSTDEYIADARRARAELPAWARAAMDRFEQRWSPPAPPAGGETTPGMTDAQIEKQAKAFVKVGALAAKPALQRTMAALTRLFPTSKNLYEGASFGYIQRHIIRTPSMPFPLAKMLAGTGTEVYESMWGPSEFHATGSLLGWSAHDVLPSIDVPTLVMSGRHDTVTPERARATAAAIPGARQVLLEDSGHCALYDEPERFVQELTRFLDDVDG